MYSVLQAMNSHSRFIRQQNPNVAGWTEFTVRHMAEIIIQWPSPLPWNSFSLIVTLQIPNTYHVAHSINRILQINTWFLQLDIANNTGRVTCLTIVRKHRKKTPVLYRCFVFHCLNACIYTASTRGHYIFRGRK